jgi:hypothetical protein
MTVRSFFPRHCEPLLGGVAIQSHTPPACRVALDRHGAKRRLAMTAKMTEQAEMQTHHA